MVFIKKKIQEELDWNTVQADEIINAGIEKLSTEESSEENIKEDNLEKSDRYYDWRDVLEILSDYVIDDAILQIKDDWSLIYPDNLISQEDIDDLLYDISTDYDEELASEIKSKIDKLQDPREVQSLDLSTDIDTLRDALDKINDINIKEKLINFIDSLK